jgi:subtilisin family serine protease
MEEMKKVLVCLFVFTAIIAMVSATTAIDLSPIKVLGPDDSASTSVFAPSQNQFSEKVNPKMDAAMNRLGTECGRKQAAKAIAVDSKKNSVVVEIPEVINNRVTVYMDLKSKKDIEDLRARYDLTGIIVTDVTETVQVNVLVEDLERLAKENAVNYIRKPSIAVINTMPDIENISSVMESKAVAEIQADKLHRIGVTGKGVETAVIDTGFFRYLNNPEIDNIKEVKSFRPNSEISPGEQSHGTIVSEIYRDISYGNLSLYTVGTSIEFASAVEHIIERGDIRVIFSCLGLSGGMPRETSISSRVVDKARDNGIIPVISAGNYGKQYYESKFIDTDGDGWHEFNNPGEKIDETQKLGFVKKGEHFDLCLNWIEANQDLDLYVIEETDQMNILGSSSGRQTGIKPASENIKITMNSEAFLHIAIHSSSEDSVINSTDLELFAERNLQYTSSDSVASPAAAKGAIAVGAVESGSRKIQDYSSCGNVSFVGISPVITWVTEPNFFDGTSAAAPSVAGAFALLMSAYPTATNEQILTAMRETAIDLGEKGWDPIYGWGLPQVYDAYQKLGETLENQ